MPCSYESAIGKWCTERELMGSVQPYTAKKSAQKASLLVPFIGDDDVSRIEPSAIKAGLIELGRTGGRSSAGLASASLRAVHLAGTQVLNWAIASGLANTNPFSSVPRPRARYRTANFLTQEQAAGIAGKAEAELRAAMAKGEITEASFALAVCIAVATGMRRGEVFALEWDAFDEQRLRIRVSKAVKPDGTVGSPKSSSGVRSIAIGGELAGIMRVVRLWHENVLPARRWSQAKHVISGKDGERASMNAFEHWWRGWADENGFEGLRFHELRHTHATLLIAGGVDVKTVQARLGHSSADITMSVYAHAIPMADCAAAVALDASLFGGD